MTPEVRAKIGVEEPLDGILIGAASGGGFAIMETLIQYTPRDLVNTWTTTVLAFRGVPSRTPTRRMNNMNFEQLRSLINQGSDLLNTAPGIKWLIIRSIDLSFGHMAYAGYFGYFIGLSVIKPEQRWKILLIGLASASLPHALWDTVASMDTVPLQAAIALLSYAVLAAAVLKAREISPNRSLLQPSVIFGASQDSAGLCCPGAEHGAERAAGRLRCTGRERSPGGPAWAGSGCSPRSRDISLRWPGGPHRQPAARRHQIPDHRARVTPARTPGAGLAGTVTGRPGCRGDPEPQRSISSWTHQPFQFRLGSSLQRHPAPDRARADDQAGSRRQNRLRLDRWRGWLNTTLEGWATWQPKCLAKS